jgi:predicted nicotinamide N-methyase
MTTLYASRIAAPAANLRGESVDESLEGRFELRRESFSHGDFDVRIDLPRSSEDLIDEAEFGKDERLPYWAELWPSARSLTTLLLEEPSLPARALELGCGVALPSLALLHRGVDVLATDYYEDALLFSRFNAMSNHLGELSTRLVDWREPPSDLPRFPLVVAADVLYEARNSLALQALLPLVVEPGGRLLLADPGRVQLEPFLTSMAGVQWRVRPLGETLEPAPVAPGRHVRVRRYEIRHVGGDS